MEKTKMITADQIREFAKQHNIGMVEAKYKLDKLGMMQDINNANSVHDLKPVLLKIIDMLN